MLMGGVIVSDGIDQLAGWHGGLDGTEEADEFPVAMLLACSGRSRGHPAR
jgi:hypothetical protein